MVAVRIQQETKYINNNERQYNNSGTFVVFLSAPSFLNFILVVAMLDCHNNSRH